MKFAGDKEYDVVYGDKDEETQVLVCLRCFEGLCEPTTDGRIFDELMLEHNKAWCPEK